MTNPSPEWLQKLWVCPKFWPDDQKIVVAPIIRSWWSKWTIDTVCHCCLWISFFEVKFMINPIPSYISLAFVGIDRIPSKWAVFPLLFHKQAGFLIKYLRQVWQCESWEAKIGEVVTTWVSSSIKMDLAHGWPISIWLYVCQINRFMNSVAPNFKVQCSVIKAFVEPKNNYETLIHNSEVSQMSL